MKNSSQKIIETIEGLAAPLCSAHALELVHIEYQREPVGRILRIFIDHLEGITLDRCSVFSRELSDLLDVYLDVPEKYTLEVSSPGLERPLSKPRDFERFQGKMAKIRLTATIDGQKTFTGVLQGVSGENVILQTQMKEVSLPFSQIAKAHLVN